MVKEDMRESSLIATELWVYSTENIFQSPWVECMVGEGGVTTFLPHLLHELRIG